ncbi:Lrp/AsnC family transcriptional regulator [Candidatus Babeliales bacterium]|nr:Lrp/AsnC family transcriptional regulator [Candidatus Babeliales bacterium]
MDALDFKCLGLLLQDGRTTRTELAAQLSLSIPAVTERIKKLEEQGLIKGYSVILDYEKLGFSIIAMIFVTLTHPQYRGAFIKKIQSAPEVLECLHVTGDDDYMLKVVCVDRSHLEIFLSDYVKAIPGIWKTRTIIALSEPKERSLELLESVKKLAKKS